MGSASGRESRDPRSRLEYGTAVAIHGWQAVALVTTVPGLFGLVVFGVPLPWALVIALALALLAVFDGGYRLLTAAETDVSRLTAQQDREAYLEFLAPAVKKAPQTSGSAGFPQFVIFRIVSRHGTASGVHCRMTIRNVDGTPVVEDNPARWRHKRCDVAGTPESAADDIPANGLPFEVDSVMAEWGGSGFVVWDDETNRVINQLGTVPTDKRLDADEVIVEMTARTASGTACAQRVHVTRDPEGFIHADVKPASGETDS